MRLRSRKKHRRPEGAMGHNFDHRKGNQPGKIHRGHPPDEVAAHSPQIAGLFVRETRHNVRLRQHNTEIIDVGFGRAGDNALPQRSK